MIRPAQPTDLDTVVALIGELAEYEHLAHEVVLDRDELAGHLFGARPYAEVLIAEADDGEPVGYALVHLRGPEETWETGERIGVLETLTVLPDERGRGIGSALFECIYAELRRLGVTELQVAVISKNAAALRFYERHGLLPFTVSFMGRVRD